MIHPYRARLVVSVASLIGLFASIYLLYVYVTGAQITCAIVGGCEAVRSSKWASVYGIPRPVTGVVFFSFIYLLLIIRAATPWRCSLWRRLTFVASLVGLAESAFLFFVQWIEIRAFCFWCLVSGVASVIIFICLCFDREEQFNQEVSQQELQFYFIALLLFFFLGGSALARLVGVF